MVGTTNCSVKVEKTVQGIDTGVDLDEILDEIGTLAGMTCSDYSSAYTSVRTAGSHEPALKEAYLRLEGLAERAAPNTYLSMSE
eukprot:2863417-Amphidinium_carterae.1